MMDGMLQHQKYVLTRVSANREVFRNELAKSLDWIQPDELGHFKDWLMEQYWETHGDIITEVFPGISGP